MRLEEALKLVVGSSVVYVVMAACAASGTGVPSSGDGAGSSSGSASNSSGSSGSGSSGGPSGIDDSGSGGSILDALTDPVDSAMASPSQNGSRLKARSIVGADGSKEFIGWHDSTLNIDCAFSAMSDGTYRCLPTSPMLAVVVANVFSDQGCTQPLALVIGKGCAAPTYVVQTQYASCVTTSQVFQVGTLYSGTVYTGLPTSCAVSTTTQTSGDYYTLSATVPLSTFAAGAVQTDP